MFLEWVLIPYSLTLTTVTSKILWLIDDDWPLWAVSHMRATLLVFLFGWRRNASFISRTEPGNKRKTNETLRKQSVVEIPT